MDKKSNAPASSSQKYRNSVAKQVSKNASSESDIDEIIQMLSLTAVDSKYSWFVVFCSFLCNMIVDGMQYTFSNFLLPILITFNSTTMAVSLIGSLLSGFYNFSGPLAGALANKFGFRMVTITGSIVSALGLGISYFATDIGILYFTYGIVTGLGFGMVYVSAVITTSLYFDKYRALATSISVCGTGIGTFVFSPFGNWLVTSYGWRIALVAEAGIVLLCIPFGLAFKPIDIISFTPVKEEDEIMQLPSMTTLRTIRTIRDSILTSFEPTKPLPNQAYPTLKQALTMQDDDGRRSLYSKSARQSTVFSLGQSLVIRSWVSASDEDGEKFVDGAGYDHFKRNCRIKCRKFCYNCWHCRCHEKKELTVGDRPMYRDDVFYEGSLSYLRNYKGDPIDYHLSVIRMPNERDAREHKRQKLWGCHEAILRTIVTMTGLNLLKSSTFVFLCISSFMYTMGVFIPYIFIRALAEQKNIEEEKSIWLVSSIGIANTAGRIVSGVLMSCVRLNAALIVFCCTVVSSLICLGVFLPIVVESVFIFTTAFGFFTAPFVSLRPIVIVEFLGLDKLTNAFGLVLLSQGVASILGPPLAGLIDEATGETSYTIVFAGALLLLSASSILASTLLVKLILSMNTRSNVGDKVQVVSKNTDGKVVAVQEPNEEEEEEEEEEFAIIPPNGGWGWVVVLSAFYCNVVTDGIQFTFGVFLQDIAKYFDVETSKISLIGSLMFGIHLIMGPVCSGLSNVHGIRPVTAAGSIITALGLSLSYFSPRYEFLYFSYGVLGGIGLGLIYMNTLVITSLYFTSLRVLAVAIVVCGTGCGTVAFAFLGNELLKITNWQTSFLIEAALAGSMFPAALTFRPLKPKRIVFTTDKALLTARHSVISRISAFSRFSRVSRVSKISRFSISSEDERRESIGTVRSRRATVYIKRNPRPSKSLLSVRTIAIEKITQQTILQQLTAQLLPSHCCRCDCCRRESIIYVHPQEKDEKFEEYVDVPRTVNTSWISAASNQSPTPVLEYTKHAVTTGRKRRFCDWSPLKRTILLMMDFKLLRSYAFLLFCFSGGFAMASMFVVLIYEKDRSIIEHGYTEDEAILLIVTLGASNMVWRLLLGLISTTVHVDVCLFSIILALFGAASAIASGFWNNLYFQHVSNVFYALGMASVAVFRPVLLIDLVGADLVLNATGISLLFMGVTCIITPPLGGLLMELTKNYNTIYYAAASLLALSGLFLINIKNLREKDVQRLQGLTRQ